MTAGLDLKQAARLAKIASMLAAPTEGERAAAAAKATALLDGAGLTWEALIQAAALEWATAGRAHAFRARWLLLVGKDLLPAQRVFLHVIQWRRSLTRFESGVLAAIADRAEGRLS